jgi:hypothetical protein
MLMLGVTGLLTVSEIELELAVKGLAQLADEVKIQVMTSLF